MAGSAAWWWADGSHTVAQISQLLGSEFGSAPDDLGAFFDLLDELGYLLDDEEDNTRSFLA